MEAELLLAEKALQPGDELAAKNTAEYSHRQEEAVLGMNPARVIWRQTAGVDDAVYVRMSLQVLSLSVEHAEEADFRTEMFGIGGDLTERCRAGLE